MRESVYSSVLDGGVVGGIVLVCKPLVFAHVQDHKETPEESNKPTEMTRVSWGLAIYDFSGEEPESSLGEFAFQSDAGSWPLFVGAVLNGGLLMRVLVCKQKEIFKENQEFTHESNHRVAPTANRSHKQGSLWEHGVGG